MQVYRGLPVLTNQSPRPDTAGRDLAADPRGLGGRVPAARPRGDRRDPRRRPDADRRRRHRPLPAGRTRRPRPAARAAARAARPAWTRPTSGSDPSEPTRCWPSAIPQAAARVHANDRRRVVRALELVELGRSLAPDEDRLWGEDTRHPTAIFGLDVPREELVGRIEAPNGSRCSSAGWRKRFARPLAGADLGDRRARSTASPTSRRFPRERGGRDATTGACAATPPTSASGCGGSRASSPSRPTGRPRDRRRDRSALVDRGAVLRPARPTSAEAVFEVQRAASLAAPRPHLPARALSVPGRRRPRPLARGARRSGTTSVIVAEQGRRDRRRRRCPGRLARRSLRRPRALGRRRSPTACTTRPCALIAAAGATSARLWVLEDNARARRFYERRGWRRDGSERVVPFPPHPLDIGYTKEL